MCSERDSPLKRLYRRTHAKLTRLAGSGQLVWARRWLRALAISRSRSAACVTGRDIQDNTSGGPAVQNEAARSHTSELTRGRFCFRVSTGGPRWAPQVSRGSSDWPGAGKTKGSRGLSLSLHISGQTETPQLYNNPLLLVNEWPLFYEWRRRNNVIESYVEVKPKRPQFYTISLVNEWTLKSNRNGPNCILFH